MRPESGSEDAKELDGREAWVMDELDKAAIEALEKHERLLHLKVMELLLGSMVRRQGVKETRKILLQYARDLREFHV